MRIHTMIAPGFLQKHPRLLTLLRIAFGYQQAESFYFLIYFLLQYRRFDLVIGYDDDGLALARQAKIASRCRMIYFSLDFLEQEGERKRNERRNQWTANLTITQDHQRANILAKLNDIPPSRIRIVHNSSLGEWSSLRHYYFHDHFGIPRSRRLVLYTGSILREHGIHGVLRALPSMPPGWVLVVHGWVLEQDEDLMVLLKDSEARWPDRLALSTQLLPFEEKHLIFQSVDAGLVTFESNNLNHHYAAGSAGKLFDFLKAGVPILGNDIPGMSDLLEGNGAGLTRPLNENFFTCLKTIEENYSTFSRAARSAFPFYEFGTSFGTVVKEVMTQKP